MRFWSVGLSAAAWRAHRNLPVTPPPPDPAATSPCLMANWRIWNWDAYSALPGTPTIRFYAGAAGPVPRPRAKLHRHRGAAGHGAFVNDPGALSSGGGKNCWVNRKSLLTIPRRIEPLIAHGD